LQASYRNSRRQGSPGRSAGVPWQIGSERHRGVKCTFCLKAAGLLVGGRPPGKNLPWASPGVTCVGYATTTVASVSPKCRERLPTWKQLYPEISRRGPCCPSDVPLLAQNGRS